jgi:AcrR family transcriptional regulator
MEAKSAKRAKPERRKPGRPGAASSVPDEREILARGLEAFAELGYDATSVRELARRLGVSHNFIHDRYESKDGFWRAVIDDALAGLEAGLEAALAAPAENDLERLRGVVRFLAAAASPPHVQLLLNFEASRGSPRLLYIFERYIQPFTLKLTPVIASLVREGVLRPVPWHVLFFLLTAPGTANGHRPLAELLGRPRGNADASASDLFADLILESMRVRG